MSPSTPRRLRIARNVMCALRKDGGRLYAVSPKKDQPLFRFSTLTTDTRTDEVIDYSYAR